MDEKYPIPQGPWGMVENTSHPSPIEQLEISAKRKKEELDAINAALAALKTNPEVANILHLVGRALQY